MFLLGEVLRRGQQGVVAVGPNLGETLKWWPIVQRRVKQLCQALSEVFEWLWLRVLSCLRRAGFAEYRLETFAACFLEAHMVQQQI